MRVKWVDPNSTCFLYRSGKTWFVINPYLVAGQVWVGLGWGGRLGQLFPPLEARTLPIDKEVGNVTSNPG